MLLIGAVAIGVNDRIAVPGERKQHGMTEPNRGADHDVGDDRAELNGRGEGAPLQKLADAGDEATRERFRRSPAS
jgi:hypothetical protein